MRKRHKTQYPGVRYRLVNEERPDGPRRYIVDYYDANGNQHSETLPLGASLEEARARKAELEGKKRTHVPVRTTVGELLDFYLAARKDSLAEKSYHTYDWGSRVVKDHMGRKQLRELTPSDCAALISKLKARGMKTHSVKKVLTPLTGALKVAVREGWIAANPLDALLPHERPKADQKQMRCMSSEEIPRLLGAADARWRPLFAALVFTGMRISEALALTWDDVNGSIRVKKGKTKAAEREIILIPSLATELRKLRLSQRPGTQYVFAGPKGTPTPYRTVSQALHRTLEKAGLPDYSLHELRHTFASILIEQGENVTLVADQMGHSDPAITLSTYAHFFDRQKNLEQARERLQASFGGSI